MAHLVITLNRLLVADGLASTSRVSALKMFFCDNLANTLSPFTCRARHVFCTGHTPIHAYMHIKIKIPAYMQGTPFCYQSGFRTRWLCTPPYLLFWNGSHDTNLCGGKNCSLFTKIKLDIPSLKNFSHIVRLCTSLLLDVVLIHL
jgi:hypothetical protein